MTVIAGNAVKAFEERSQCSLFFQAFQNLHGEITIQVIHVDRVKVPENVVGVLVTGNRINWSGIRLLVFKIR